MKWACGAPLGGEGRGEEVLFTWLYVELTSSNQSASCLERYVELGYGEHSRGSFLEIQLQSLKTINPLTPY
jgi:hypothetical protein